MKSGRFPHGFQTGEPSKKKVPAARINPQQYREAKTVRVSNQSQESSTSTAVVGGSVENWYAVQTRARHEKAVACRLCERGVTTFLPTVTEVHRWKDRRKTVSLPLFNCYLFVKMMPSNEERQRVLRVDSVLGLVGTAHGMGTPIPDEQIDAIRILVSERIPWRSHPFLKIGQRVRIRGGALDGIEGILESRRGDRRLVISVDAVQRSLAVQIEGYDVEPV
jgi:transcription antitermination factor NusG